MSEPTSLYRFYGRKNLLLYIGITNNMIRRFGTHGEQKSWHPDVVRVEVEHYPSRQHALSAEAAAIAAEAPIYNVQHNQGRGRVDPAQTRSGGRWEFRNKRSNFRFQADLYLYPELDGSSMVDDYYGELDGEGQLDEYISYVQRNYPDQLRSDAVPIYWYVQGPGICEGAPPFLGHNYHGPVTHFLDFFTWPRDVNTGDQLDWFSLPVLNDRFPEFAEALAWKPSPFQLHCPLRTIVASRRGWFPRSPRDIVEMEA